MKHLKEKLESLSRKPGVYLFKDKEGRIIYIGKAKVLRNRVRSYFQDPSRLDIKTQHLVPRIADLETIITDTEVEALILEATLIKEHQPRYNINLKDDKSFPFIRVTEEPFPRIFPTRKIVRDGSRYFGPYTDVQGMKALLAAAKKLFPVRSCNLPLTEESIRAGRFKVCLDYHIHRCQGPCEGFVDREEYRRTIEYVIDFIKGRTEAIEKDIRRRMEKAAADLRFEEAAQLRDRLAAVEQFRRRQKVLDPQLGDRDVISLAVDEGDACCVVFKVRRGRLIGRDFFILQNAEGEKVSALVASFIQQYYLKSEDVPPEILVPCPLDEERPVLEAWLAQSGGQHTRLVHPQEGEEAKLIEMGERNARHHLDELRLKKQQAREGPSAAVIALQKALGLPKTPLRIEGFDISNIQGTNPVASMVCFINGRAAKSEYRRFRIRVKDTPDDFAMMKEVVRRRAERLLKSGAALPDLILIDGGKGQLNAALEALHELGIQDQPILALAKRLDEVFIPQSPDPQNVPRHSAALKLLQQVRDEAHRFAVTYHRKLRGKAAVVSLLDGIPGVGKRRRELLLRHFGSIERIKAAHVDELRRVPGIPAPLAEKIAAFFRSGT